jgi:hypothetical protein
VIVSFVCFARLKLDFQNFDSDEAGDIGTRARTIATGQQPQYPHQSAATEPTDLVQRE